MTDEELLEALRDMPVWPMEEAADRIEELTKALGWFVNDVRFTVQVGGNPLTVPGMIDAATKIYFGETLHVAETCKENGETFT